MGASQLSRVARRTPAGRTVGVSDAAGGTGTDDATFGDRSEVRFDVLEAHFPVDDRLSDPARVRDSSIAEGSPRLGSRLTEDETSSLSLPAERDPVPVSRHSDGGDRASELQGDPESAFFGVPAHEVDIRARPRSTLENVSGALFREFVSHLGSSSSVVLRSSDALRPASGPRSSSLLRSRGSYAPHARLRDGRSVPYATPCSGRLA